MTRKDFQLIAEAMRDMRHLHRGDNAIHLSSCHIMADHLATTNPRFDRERFVAACVA